MMDEKLKHYLTVHELAALITESFPHGALAKMAASGGLSYPGRRLESVSRMELAVGIAEDAWDDPGIFKFLVTALDKIHAEDIEEIRTMGVDKIGKILSRTSDICKENQVGKLVWALLRDSREEVADLIPRFLESVRRLIRKARKERDATSDLRERLDKGELSQTEVTVLNNVLRSTKQELEAERKKTEELHKRVGTLVSERDHLKEELSAKRHQVDDLAAEAGRLKKEVAARDSLIASLKEAAARNPLAEERLRHDLHHLEREYRKREHELGEARERWAGIQAELEAKSLLCSDLRRSLADLGHEKALLEGKIARLEEEKKEPARLEKPREEAPASPMAKGKRLGIFVDMSNVWLSAKRLARKVDFQKLLDLIVRDRHLVKAVAYVVVVPEFDQGAFFDMLKRKGFEVRYRTLIRRSDGSAKGNWDTGIVVDALRLVDKNDLDIAHVVSGDGDFIDLFKFLRMKGIRAEASGFPFNTALDLPKAVDAFFPLDENVLKDEQDSFVLR